MMTTLLNKIAERLPCRFIEVNGWRYLNRYTLARFGGWELYLHQYVGADDDGRLHNHPREGYSIILSGGYVEERAVDISPLAGISGCITEKRTVRWFNRVRSNCFHRIAEIEPNTWTLFLFGPTIRIKRGGVSYRKGWGFIERRGAEVVFTPEASYDD